MPIPGGSPRAAIVAPALSFSSSWASARRFDAAVRALRFTSAMSIEIPGEQQK